MTSSLATVSYLGATILFILSLGGLSNPETSRRGNLYGIVGMTIAVLATVLGPRVAAADDPGADDPRHAGRGDARTEHRGQHGDGHADDAEQVAAARALGVREAAQAEDEEDGGADVGDGGKTGAHVRALTCGTSPACAA